MITPKERLDLIENIRQDCRKLFMTTRIGDRCDAEGTPKQLEFVLEMLEAELSAREENRKARLLKQARFPIFKSLEGYSYKYVRLPPSLDKETLESAGFLSKHDNLVLFGSVGLGKTHLAIAVGITACVKGYKTRFYTVTELVIKLADARKKGTLERLRNELNSLDLLILDEWGYVPVDREGSQLLFQVISDSYEKKSLILTTNMEFSKWGGIFTDDQMTAAMIDRLVHHGHLLVFEGPSYRMEHALMKQQ